MLRTYPIPTEEDDVAAGWPTQKAVRRAKRALGDEALTRGVGLGGSSTGGEFSLTEIARIAVTAAGLPELVSHAEVRSILGTKNPRLPAGTPDPLYEDVGGRQLWLRDDIVAFAEEFKQRPNVRLRRQP